MAKNLDCYETQFLEYPLLSEICNFVNAGL